jgi:hypothetical protein
LQLAGVVAVEVIGVHLLSLFLEDVYVKSHFLINGFIVPDAHTMTAFNNVAGFLGLPPRRASS